MNDDAALRRFSTPNHKPRSRLNRRGLAVLGAVGLVAVLAADGNGIIGSFAGEVTSAVNPSPEAISQSTITAIQVGEGVVDPNAEVTYGPNTFLYSSPSNTEEAGDGSSNVVYKIPQGQELRVKGVVAGPNPDDVVNKGFYEAISVTLPGQGDPSVVWTPYNGDSNTSVSGEAQVAFLGNAISVGTQTGNFLTAQGSLVNQTHN